MSENEIDKKELKDMSVEKIFTDDGVIYEVPIYQRNFAWGKDEIKTFIQDVYDAYEKNKGQKKEDQNAESAANGKKEKPGIIYYIGTLVTFRKDDGAYEVIDGQQRLTAVGLILSALEGDRKDKFLNKKLTYRSRTNSVRALRAINSIIEETPSGEKEETSCAIQDRLEHFKKVLADNNYTTFGGGPTDQGIIEGFKFAIYSLSEIVGGDLKEFKEYVLKNVHIIRYQVPKDTDLNQYFEIMNSRGEQLEQHEIVKADLMKILGEQNEEEKGVFAAIWEICSKMDCYIQQSFRRQFNQEKPKKDFWKELSRFPSEITKDNILELGQEDLQKRPESTIDDDCKKSTTKNSDENNENKKQLQLSIDKLCEQSITKNSDENNEIKEQFQSIIDFPNFLLIVLKITVLLKQWTPKENEDGTNKKTEPITLDDKNLKKHFGDYFPGDNGPGRVRIFAYNLLKAKFFLDNYVVHRSKEQREEVGKNPWRLQVWGKDDEGSADEKKKSAPHNLCEEHEIQEKLVQILSMFEVTYGSRQRKNYLFYCLLFLMGRESKYDKPDSEKTAVVKYLTFLEELAERYLHEFYLKGNSDFSGNFDGVMLEESKLKRTTVTNNTSYKPENFFNYEQQNTTEQSPAKLLKIFGNGNIPSSGIPLFIFNYLDYKIWKLYRDMGEKDFKEKFNGMFGCQLSADKKEEDKSGLNRNVFKDFFFSRSRDSLEHYFPTANLRNKDDIKKRELDENGEEKINCLGNYAMIGGSANSSGSNWTPEEKVDHYLSSSNKIDRVSVSSLKFRIMLKICDEKKQAKDLWTWKEIKEHQKKMMGILFAKNDSNNSKNGKADPSESLERETDEPEEI